MRAKALFILIFIIYQNNFSQVKPSAREISLANSTVAIPNNSNAIFYNSAGISLLKNSEISFFYSPSPFGIREMANGNFSTNYDFGFSQVGFGISTYGYDLYRENSFNISISKEISEDIFLGISPVIRFVNIKNYGNSAVFLLNFGFLTNIVKNLSFGFNLENLTNSSYKNTDNQVPVIYNLGFAYKPFEQIFISTSLEKEFDFPISAKFGVDYSPLTFLNLRIGAKTEPNSYSAGIGINYLHIRLDYAIFTNLYLSETHQFAISIEIENLLIK